ncbi:hypothetical protein CRI94_08205 [Longibacter salinarum]|uniref:Uncharacterized protein n=1 Tax=Longibacter salinarum TaxID=1850348 RepID=A0A2A8CZG7_9BACT|nr:hypothetical protein [Longibacter salinarum]PEN14020.1 hypothetical protein CRI94_08205 [Longibacter salinarum]
MNVELLESVRQAIVFYPRRFSAAQWAFARNADAVIENDVSPEGFKCCIAGHVLLESDRMTERELLRVGGFHTGGELWDEAARALSLTESQCRELFFPSQWDKPYKQNYYLCSSDDEAEVVASYLEYFVHKYGTDVEREAATRLAAAAERPMPVHEPNPVAPHARATV